MYVAPQEANLRAMISFRRYAVPDGGLLQESRPFHLSPREFRVQVLGDRRRLVVLSRFDTGSFVVFELELETLALRTLRDLHWEFLDREPHPRLRGCPRGMGSLRDVAVDADGKRFAMGFVGGGSPGAKVATLGTLEPSGTRVDHDGVAVQGGLGPASVSEDIDPGTEGFTHLEWIHPDRVLVVSEGRESVFVPSRGVLEHHDQPVTFLPELGPGDHLATPERDGYLTVAIHQDYPAGLPMVQRLSGAREFWGWIDLDRRDRQGDRGTLSLRWLRDERALLFRVVGRGWARIGITRTDGTTGTLLALPCEHADAWPTSDGGAMVLAWHGGDTFARHYTSEVLRAAPSSREG
jgi:hypothetical protein